MNKKELIKLIEIVVKRKLSENSKIEQYAINTRDMHTAIHNLYVVNKKSDVIRLDNLFKALRKAKTEDKINNIWYVINNKFPDLEVFEINYREIDDDDMYGNILIWNDNSYDIYM